MHANVLKNNNTYTAAKIAKMEESLVREKQSHANCKQQAIPCAYLHVPTDMDFVVMITHSHITFKLILT